VTVTVDPAAMAAVTRDSGRALAAGRGRVDDVTRLATDLPAGSARERLGAILADADRVLVRLARVVELPARMAAAMVDLEGRSRPVIHARATVPRTDWHLAGPPRASTVSVARDLSALVARASSPAAVAERWDRMTPTRRRALVRAHGPTVANLDGIPIVVRDTVHRVTIASEIARLSQSSPRAAGLLGAPGNDLVGTMRRHEIAQQIGWLRGVATADRVLSLDLTGDGRAVLAVGDPTSAAHVATLVPGIGTTLRDSERLLAEARALRDHATAAGGGELATIAWLGYDTPPGPVEAITRLLRHDPIAAVEASTARVADGAAGALARHAAAVRAGNPDVHHTVVAHSYGSVVALRAVGVHDHLRADVDDVVVLGSPGAGAGVDRAALDWPHGIGLWHATARTDPVPRLPVLGPDAATLGARPLPLGRGNHGHVRYLAPKTFGLDGVALVVAGSRGCPVPPTNGRTTSGTTSRIAPW